MKRRELPPDAFGLRIDGTGITVYTDDDSPLVFIGRERADEDGHCVVSGDGGPPPDVFTPEGFRERMRELERRSDSE